MATTLATLLTNIRLHIDEPVSNYWTNAELTSYIVNRQLDLWRRIYRLKEDYFIATPGATVNLVAGQYIYQTADGIPANLFRVSSIRSLTSGQTGVKFIMADPASNQFIDGLRPDITVSNPSIYLYAIRGNGMLWVSPTPQAPLQILIDYIQLPTEVVNPTDTFLIPDPFIDYVEYAATGDALVKGPVGAPDMWYAKAEQAWSDISMALDTDRSDQNPVVSRSFSGADDGGDW